MKSQARAGVLPSAGRGSPVIQSFPPEWQRDLLAVWTCSRCHRSKKAESRVWPSALVTCCVTSGKGPALSGPRWPSWKPLLLTPSLQGPWASVPPGPSTGQASPTAWQAAGGGSRRGGKRQEGPELQEPAGPGRLLNPGAWPASPHRPAPCTARPRLRIANIPGQPRPLQPGRGNCGRRGGRQKHLTPSLLQAEPSGGGALGLGPGAAPGPQALSGRGRVNHCSPGWRRLPTWTHRL